ncbi:cytochrome b/b6 domain-containing protein [Halomonas sp. 328]|uniref:cytochrome b/b6 domain-containing protein n=1 Tax=Halomonas sp. 328 TaxID=2776704 RepID=UPI0018A6E31B|nr:cytochrome b/b6 domain-containing protein [Halomonas sp. 328]MBF8221602.1 cytochrome b/b6 domain-containing protein [Halomonas sp. 328]
MGAIRVWDIPTRAFHWCLVLAVALAFYTVKTPGWPLFFPVEWHARAGYVVLGLLLFRGLWGVWGGHYARFSQFLYGPRRLLCYARALLKGRQPSYAGHNPLGGLMVLVMLMSLTLQGLTGLVMSDDIFFDGPLRGTLGRDVEGWLSTLHHRNGEVLMWLVGLHLVALLVHRLKGEALVMAMVTGRKRLASEPQDEGGAAIGRPWLALLSMTAALLLVIWLWWG